MKRWQLALTALFIALPLLTFVNCANEGGGGGNGTPGPGVWVTDQGGATTVKLDLANGNQLVSAGGFN